MNEVEFYSAWSEIIFAFHLSRLNYKIIRMGQAKGEASEIADIITDKGLFEVTAVVSEKDRYEADTVFWGSNEISSISRKIINSKILKKRNQNKATRIVIDCTFMDDLTDKLLTSTFLGIESDFNVFKECYKDLTLFTRNSVTQQVGANRTLQFHS